MVISGSSMIQINKQQADLSRRVKEYKLANLSFREYLLFKGVFDFESISIEEVFENHFEIASSIKKEIKPLEYFRAYLDEGCYPFSVMSQKSQTHYLIGIINQILEVDMPYVSNIKYSHIDKIKKLIYLLSSSVPLKPNISKLSIAIEVSRSTLLEYLHYLELGNLINVVNQKARGYNTISKPDKLFIHNTNLQKAISHDINIGTAREVFFVNQLKSANQNAARLLDDYLLLSNSGDFIIDGKWIVEVGGKNKSFNQIKDLANSFVVADDIEVGFGAKIPLWLFGFLY
jgi:predicted AAA+ superfamily ATPase